jgi:hypothetical protein
MVKCLYRSRFSTLSLHEVKRSDSHHPLYSWETSSRYLLNTRLGGSQSQSGLCAVREISCTCQELNPYSLATQPIASCYTDWNILGICLEGLKQNMTNLSQGSWSLGWDSLLLHQPIQCNSIGLVNNYLNWFCRFELFYKTWAITLCSQECCKFYEYHTWILFL